MNLTLPGLTATGNVLVKIRLQIFNQLSGSPRVIQGQTVNLPGVHRPSMTRNQKWHVTSEKWGLFSSWLTCLVCLHEPRTGLWHPLCILSVFQILHFHDYLHKQAQDNLIFLLRCVRLSSNAAWFLSCICVRIWTAYPSIQTMSNINVYDVAFYTLPVYKIEST